MEPLLALVVLGLLGAVTLYGNSTGMQAARGIQRRGASREDRPRAGVFSD